MANYGDHLGPSMEALPPTLFSIQETSEVSPAQKAAVETRAGHLVESIPRKMPLGQRQTVEVRLGDASVPTMAQGLLGQGDVHPHALTIVEAMKVEMYSQDGAFSIEPWSEAEQLVIKKALVNTLLSSPHDYASWKWAVTPQKRGSHKLCFRISARVKDSDGSPVHHTIVPDREIEIEVKVGWFAARTTAQKLALFIMGAFGTAVAASFFAGSEVVEASAGMLWGVIEVIKSALGI
ncbi:MAG: hypothetical protein AB7S74_17565 [Hyphomicrobium sp.]